MYLRSFADSDGDGLGDLRGLVDRIDYLADLGVDAIWLAPFYPSPLGDGGYDIVDHRDVDPPSRHARRLRRARRARHTPSTSRSSSTSSPTTRPTSTPGSGRPWPPAGAAASAIGTSSATAPATSRRPTGVRTSAAAPGTRWPTGSGTAISSRREQPDLNWGNAEVRAYFRDTLRFWADRGVDGFRIDVAHSLAKDLSEPLRSQPHLDTRLPLDGSDPLYDREEVHTIYRDWRRVFDEYDPPRMAVAETWHPTNDRTYLYARPTELGQVFDFSLLKSPWDRDTMRVVIERSLHHQRATGGGLTWVLSSHDVPRHASRLALARRRRPRRLARQQRHRPADRRHRRQTPGPRRHPDDARPPRAPPTCSKVRSSACSRSPTSNPTSSKTPCGGGPAAASRGATDAECHCRGHEPAPRSASDQGGAWLPQPAWFGDESVEAQTGDPDSTLTLYRTALRLRRSLQPGDDDLAWGSDHDDGLLHFRRSNGWNCLVNFGSHPVPPPPGEILLASQPLVDATVPGRHHDLDPLSSDATVMLHLDDRWIWDFWLIDDGPDHHVFYLQAPRSLGDPELRHRHATIGHAVSSDLRSWEQLPDALGPGPAGAWDDNAPWTGSIIRAADRWHLCYTGTCSVDGGAHPADRDRRVRRPRSTGNGPSTIPSSPPTTAGTSGWATATGSTRHGGTHGS